MRVLQEDIKLLSKNRWIPQFFLLKQIHAKYEIVAVQTDFNNEFFIWKLKWGHIMFAADEPSSLEYNKYISQFWNNTLLLCIVGL